MEADTIFALSSGAARSGVAVIRVSGPAVPRVLETFVSRPVKPREAALRVIRDPRDGSILDHGLVLHFPAPHSFTGEDVVEFQVHGSLAVMRQLLARLGDTSGLRPALPGEFTRRAWLNGRLDLLEVEALSDTLAAETELQRKLAIQGSRWLRAKTETWRADLLAVRALVEAEIDFADEGDVIDRLDSQKEQHLRALASELRSAAGSLRAGQQLRNGFRVAILGAPNAGKSSLLNSLADRDVAITSPIAGTTRDVVETVIDLDGLPVILMDTAGLRNDTDDAIEAEGIRRSQQAGAQADLVLWASAVDAPTDPPEGGYLVVYTKCDLGLENRVSGLHVSSLTGTGIDSLTKEIRRRSQLGSLDQGAEGIIAHERHAIALLQAASSIERAASYSAATMDLRAEELRIACQALDQLVGRLEPEQILGEIFSRFCLGK